MAPIYTLIFSRDRAMQLDLLLYSMSKFAPQLHPVRVLYRASNKEFEEGYYRLRCNWKNVGWIPETDFNAQLLGCLRECQAGRMGEDSDYLEPYPYISFLVDDDVFYRPLPPDWMPSPGEAYAPRLGNNCTYCFNLSRPMNQQEGDFRCTMSLDGHIYLADEILPTITQHAPYCHPNNIEDKLWDKISPRLRYAEQSCLVGIPHNRVGTHPNPNGGGSVVHLNDRFLQGERIVLEDMDFSNVHGVHQIIPYVFGPQL